MTKNRHRPPDAGPPIEGAGSEHQGSISLLCREGRNRDLVRNLLAESHHVSVVSSPDDLVTTDLCVVDQPQFESHQAGLERWKTIEDPSFAPILLLVNDRSHLDLEPAWRLADEIIEVPVATVELRARVENLLDRRRTATALAASRKRLEETVEDLRVKERAMDAAPIGITISDPDQPDNPLVYVNKAFEELTGYDRSHIVGENCRILQGAATGEEPVATMAAAIEREDPVAVDVLNYRADGSKFWNHVEIAPVHSDGELKHFVGFQSDITDRKIKEQRITVLNRLLTHNLRNHLNIIQGYADLLQTTSQDDSRTDAIQKIDHATEHLQLLSEGVRRIESSIGEHTPDATFGHQGPPIELTDLISNTVETVEELYPSAEIETVGSEEHVWVDADGVSVALKEAIENGIKHSESERPSIGITVTESMSTGTVEVEIVDDGPGIPAHEQAVIQNEVETALHHSDGVGLWLMHWILESSGGELRFGEGGDGGGSVIFSLPRAQPPHAGAD